jgi:GIY-YIG catalytic domain
LLQHNIIVFLFIIYFIFIKKIYNYQEKKYNNNSFFLHLNVRKSSFPLDYATVCKARNRLIKIFSYFKNRKELIKFIFDYSLYFDESFINTYKSSILLNLNNLDFKYINILIKSKEEIKKYKNEAGIYIIKDNNSSHFYIGSSINIYSRFKGHLFNYLRTQRGGNSLFYKYVKASGGWSQFSMYIIKKTPNCLFLFIKKYPHIKLTKGEVLVLNFLSLFIVRTYELFYINKYEPPLNEYNHVIYPFMNFDIKSLKKISLKYKVFNTDYSLLTKFDSISILSLNLGISKTSTYKYLNVDKTVYSKNYDAYVYIKSKDYFNHKKSIINNFWNHKKYPNISNVELNKLPSGLIALDKNKITILGKFDSIKEAALTLDNKIEVKYISRYINKEKLVKTSKYYCYFVRNEDKSIAIKYERNKKSIVLFDIINKNLKLFNRIKDLLLYLGRKSGDDTKMVKKYMINGNNNKLYKKRYMFLYLNEILINPQFYILSKYLNTNYVPDNVPILSINSFNNSLILYIDVKYIKLSLNDNIDVNSYLYLSNNKYKNEYQFLYLVDYYSDNIYKNFVNTDVDVKF